MGMPLGIRDASGLLIRGRGTQNLTEEATREFHLNRIMEKTRESATSFKRIGEDGKETDLGPCHIWDSSHRLSRNGYGRYWYVGVGEMQAHRARWELEKGPIPEGHDLDHLCLNRQCNNPVHLEPVTGGENTWRAHAHAPRVERAGQARFAKAEPVAAYVGSGEDAVSDVSAPAPPAAPEPEAPAIELPTDQALNDEVESIIAKAGPDPRAQDAALQRAGYETETDPYAEPERTAGASAPRYELLPAFALEHVVLTLTDDAIAGPARHSRDKAFGAALEALMRYRMGVKFGPDGHPLLARVAAEVLYLLEADAGEPSARAVAQDHAEYATDAASSH